MELALSSTCSRSDPPFCCKDVAHVDSPPPHNMMIWTDVSVPFPYGKSDSGDLGSFTLCGTKSTLFFRQAQYVQVFPLKPAPFCKLFVGLGSTNESAISLLFSSSTTLALSLPPCPFLRLFLSNSLANR